MSSQPGCSDGRRGRLSRDERAKLVRKERSRTSGRESGRIEHCQTSRSRTSGRDLRQRVEFDPRQVARSSTSGRKSDGGREQVLVKHANRNQSGFNNNDNNNDNNKDERSPFRLNNNDKKRESQVEQINAFLLYFPSR